MLIEWRLGLPVVPLPELLPPPTWTLYTHPTLPLVFYYPPDWTPVALWAETLSPEGMPIWLDQPPLIPQLSLARVVAPANDAAFEFAVGNVQGPVLAPAQAAWIAKQGLLGEHPQLQPICALEDPNPLAPGWFHADYVQSSIIASGGNAIGQPNLFLPGTTVTYQNLIGPRDRFADLVRTVFLRILTQFLGGGETPTPEPDDGDHNGL